MPPTKRVQKGVRGACRCGCGELAARGRDYVQGHWSRTAEARAVHAARRTRIEPPNPSGLCMCGCGSEVPRAVTTKTAAGLVGGEYVRYLPGHQNHRAMR